MEAAPRKTNSGFGVASVIVFVVTLLLLTWRMIHGHFLVHHVITDIGSWDRSDGSAVWEYQVGLTVVLVIIGSQLGVALGIAGIRGAGRRADLSMIGLMGNAVLLLMSLSVILRQVTR